MKPVQTDMVNEVWRYSGLRGMQILISPRENFYYRMNGMFNNMYMIVYDALKQRPNYFY